MSSLGLGERVWFADVKCGYALISEPLRRFCSIFSSVAPDALVAKASNCPLTQTANRPIARQPLGALGRAGLVRATRRGSKAPSGRRERKEEVK